MGGVGITKLDSENPVFDFGFWTIPFVVPYLQPLRRNIF